jgi:uncharacterized membrane protein
MQNNVTEVTAKRRFSTFQVAVAALFAALVAVATMTLAFPIPATQGYFNLGDTFIYVAASIFGPFTGLIAGAGAAIADMVKAPGYVGVTFFVKSIEGFLVGFFVRLLSGKIKNFTLCVSIAVLIGGFEMVVGYFVYESFLYGYGTALSLVPVNVCQVLLGLVIAVPIIHAVLRVFPQFKNYLWRT